MHLSESFLIVGGGQIEDNATLEYVGESETWNTINDPSASVLHTVPLLVDMNNFPQC